MNPNQELKIQAFIDHELPPQEALEVAEWITKDAEAKKLHEELKQIRALTASNELQRSMPCAPEFFWSQIEKQIRPQSVVKAKPAIEFGWIWRMLAPASALMLMALILLPQHRTVHSELTAISGSEVETAIEDAKVVTFRSEAEGVSIVWVDMD